MLLFMSCQRMLAREARRVGEGELLGLLPSTRQTAQPMQHRSLMMTVFNATSHTYILRFDFGSHDERFNRKLIRSSNKRICVGLKICQFTPHQPRLAAENVRPYPPKPAPIATRDCLGSEPRTSPPTPSVPGIGALNGPFAITYNHPTPTSRNNRSTPSGFAVRCKCYSGKPHHLIRRTRCAAPVDSVCNRHIRRLFPQ